MNFDLKELNSFVNWKEGTKLRISTKCKVIYHLVDEHGYTWFHTDNEELAKELLRTIEGIQKEKREPEVKNSGPRFFYNR